MADDLTPRVETSDIIRLVGRATFERGSDYARHGAVLRVDVAIDRDGGAAVSGTVAGSGVLPYTCLVRLEETAESGRFRPKIGSCSCPMTVNCKHVAAALITFSAGSSARVYAPTPAVSTPRRAASRASATPQPEGWKALFAAPHASSNAPPATTRLGLYFELREQTPRTASRWHGPVARTAAAHTDTPATTRLAVRPATLSSTGNWVRGQVTWSNIGYQTHRLSLDAAQQRWFTTFAALHRANRDLTAIGESDWLTLDDFRSPLLWALLAEASDLGIALVSSKKGTPVVVGSEAVIALDASRTADSGLSLHARLTIDGTPNPIDRANAIENHGVYAYSWEPTALITLAPSPGLTAEKRRMLANRSTIVPAAEVDEFLSSYYPRLARTTIVVSSDSSVELPEPQPAVLVLTASYEPKHRLHLGWQWDYDGRRMPLSHTLDVDPLRDLERERRIERAAAGILGIESLPAADTLTGIAAAEFTAAALPRLEAVDDIQVEIRGEKPDYRELTDAPKLTFTTVETDHRDWFDLGVIVTVDGRKVPFGPLFTALATGRKKLLLVDNSYLSLNHPAFDELHRLIAESSNLDEWETGPRINRYQASLWAEFEDLAEETVEAESWRRSARALRDIDSVPSIEKPAALAANLRPYQQDGLDWLALLHAHQLGGVLADDMGLGKTLQALALIAHVLEEDPGARFLVVAPTSVVSGWAAEAARFLPDAHVVAVTQTQKKSGSPLVNQVSDAHIVITSYALFRLDFAAYNSVEWSALILDEAQFVKNPASRAHKCAVDLDAPAKFALTGTPMENSLMDLWALFAIVAPGLFPSARRFTEFYVRPIAQRENADFASARLDTLRRRIRPLMKRRSKAVVAAELPPKQEQVLAVELSPRHREIYDLYLQRERQKLLGLVDDLDRNRFIVFRSLTLLRMLALHAALIDDVYENVASAKLDALFDNLHEVIAEGHRVLVFSQFTSFLRMVADRMDAEHVDYAYLDGSTLNRAAVISSFTNGDAPIFLVSLKAGGFGLNLTEADYVYLLDPWWNPASENQAIDRTHRIGQTRSVNVYRMVAIGTIEEKVMALRDRKAQLFDAVMDDDGAFSETLTADDIRGLLDL